MKKLTSLAIFTFFALNVFSQDLNVPRDYEFKTKEDYTKYQADLLTCINWLTNTPINVRPEKRKEANAFVLKWITGSPEVSIELNPKIVNFMEPNADLMIIFLCGWTKSAIETNQHKNKIQGNLKGLESVIEFYKKNKENLSKDKNVEKYIKVQEKGELEDFVTKSI